MNKRLSSLILLVLLSGCTTARVSPWNPLRFLPFASGSTPDTVEPEPHSYESWFHALAIASFIFFVVSSYIHGKPTKKNVFVLFCGMGFSVWGLAVDSIKENIGRFLPWAIGVALAYIVIDLGTDYLKKRPMRLGRPKETNPTS